MISGGIYPGPTYLEADRILAYKYVHIKHTCNLSFVTSCMLITKSAKKASISVDVLILKSDERYSIGKPAVTIDIALWVGNGWVGDIIPNFGR